MEQPLYSVLVYSKYSDNCKNIFTMIEQSGVDFSPLKLLCIDNDVIRERIMKDTKIQIKYVPCIISIFNNGNFEKYEGLNCIDWIKSIISVLKPEPIKKVEFAKPIENVIQIEEKEEEEDDRHKNVNQPKRIRKNESSYEENEDFYTGEQVNNRKENKKSLKQNISNVKDRDGIMARARQMEIGREMEEKNIKKKPLIQEENDDEEN